MWTDLCGSRSGDCFCVGPKRQKDQALRAFEVLVPMTGQTRPHSPARPQASNHQKKSSFRVRFVGNRPGPRHNSHHDQSLPNGRRRYSMIRFGWFSNYWPFSIENRKALPSLLLLLPTKYHETSPVGLLGPGRVRRLSKSELVLF
jgi:hypothetical protein